MTKYVVLGTSSFLSDVFDLIHANKGIVHAIFQNMNEVNDDRVLSVAKRVELLGYPVRIAPLSDDFKPENGCKYVLGFTAVKKRDLVHQLKEKCGIRFDRLVHPSAVFGSNVRIGEGVVVNTHVAVGPNARLDDHCVVNRAASIGHDAVVGKFTRIGPSAAIAGSARIGSMCSVGMGACVLDRVYVGDGSVVGAGSLVTRDLPDGVVAVGSPSKVIGKNEETAAIRGISR